MSKSIALSVKPNCPACLNCCASAAPLNNALVGMHPQLRHTPPKCCFSTIAVFNPSCAERIAATYPPVPAPITTRSNCVSDMAVPPTPKLMQDFRQTASMPIRIEHPTHHQ